MKKKLLLLPLLLLLLPCLSVRADPGKYVYNIVSVTQTGPGTITVTVEAHYCSGCHPDDRYVKVRIISSMGLFDETLTKDTDMATDWPLNTLVSWDFVFTGLTLQYCDYVSAYLDVWCSLCGSSYDTELDILHIIPETPLGTIMGVIACFAAVAVFIRFKRPKWPLLN